MIVAVSTFRVANGLEGDVRAAFAARPRLVDAAPGFLGLEVFTDSADGSVFHLVTRWTGREPFERWHGSPEHRSSHALIPRGLRLDPAFTRVQVLDRLREAHPEDVPEAHVRDGAAVIARHLADARAFYLLVADGSGAIDWISPALARRAGVDAAVVKGRPVRDLLAAADGALLERTIAARARGTLSLLLSVRAPQGAFTIRATVDAGPGRLVIAGEPLLEDEVR
jgi:heme-degrading monooxygenase HmoA